MTKQIKGSLDEIVEAVSLQILIHNNNCVNSNDLLNYPISMNLIRTALAKFVVEEELCICSKGKGIDYDENGNTYCIDCGKLISTTPKKGGDDEA